MGLLLGQPDGLARRRSGQHPITESLHHPFPDLQCLRIIFHQEDGFVTRAC